MLSAILFLDFFSKNRSQTSPVAIFGSSEMFNQHFLFLTAEYSDCRRRTTNLRRTSSERVRYMSYESKTQNCLSPCHLWWSSEWKPKGKRHANTRAFVKLILAPIFPELPITNLRKIIKSDPKTVCEVFLPTRVIICVCEHPVWFASLYFCLFMIDCGVFLAGLTYKTWNYGYTANGYFIILLLLAPTFIQNLFCLIFFYWIGIF